MTMLDSHMTAVEESLLHTSNIPANAGHTLHRGTPRENLISNFLESHLSANVAIGTGEIIDCNSKPRESRNQFDIVIYRRNYPKLDFGGVNGFLVESVVATIEVKSLLDEAAMHQAVNAAANLKKLEAKYTKVATFGWIPPKPLSFVIAYKGPASMATARDWQLRAEKSLNLTPNSWDKNRRLEVSANSLDGVSVLGVGGNYLCNTPTFPDSIDDRARTFSFDSRQGSLLFFFLVLQRACMNVEMGHLDTQAYLQDHVFNGTFFDK